MSFLKSSIIHVHPLIPVLFLLAWIYLFIFQVCLMYRFFCSIHSILSCLQFAFYFAVDFLLPLVLSYPQFQFHASSQPKVFVWFFNLITCHRIHVVVLNRHTIPHVCTWVFYFIYLWFIVVDIFRVLHFPLDFQNNAPLFCSAGLFPQTTDFFSPPLLLNEKGWLWFWHSPCGSAVELLSVCSIVASPLRPEAGGFMCTSHIQFPVFSTCSV